MQEQLDFTGNVLRREPIHPNPRPAETNNWVTLPTMTRSPNNIYNEIARELSTIQLKLDSDLDKRIAAITKCEKLLEEGKLPTTINLNFKPRQYPSTTSIDIQKQHDDSEQQLIHDFIKQFTTLRLEHLRIDKEIVETAIITARDPVHLGQTIVNKVPALHPISTLDNKEAIIRNIIGEASVIYSTEAAKRKHNKEQAAVLPMMVDPQPLSLESMEKKFDALHKSMEILTKQLNDITAKNDQPDQHHHQRRSGNGKDGSQHQKARGKDRSKSPSASRQERTLKGKDKEDENNKSRSRPASKNNGNRKKRG